MYCIICNKHIVDCTCADIEERLKALQKNPVVSLAATSNLNERIKRRYLNDAKTADEHKTWGTEGGLMYCNICKKHVGDCTCGDIEERLKALQKNPVMSLAAASNLNERIKRRWST